MLRYYKQRKKLYNNIVKCIECIAREKNSNK